jgi:hypothetical protein
MREKLVCYLLGELDEAERAELEVRLANEPRLRKELEQIRGCLEGHRSDSPEASGSQDDCPEDLAARTANCISRIADRIDAPCRRSRYSFVDVCVAAGVLLAIGAMILPALPRSRGDSRRMMCQENMRQLGQALVGYADNHDNFFPYIQPDENAGMFSVRLAESGQLSQQDLQRLLWCRASKIQDGSSRVMIVVPKTTELQDARGQALAMLKRWMAGSYAYRLGYVKGDRYYPIQNYSSSRSPILSDAPTRTPDGWTSLNHVSSDGLGGGQNVLNQDGSVRFLVGYGCPAMDANLFVNRQGLAAAGDDESDVVLVRSDLTPGVGPEIKPMVPAVLRSYKAGAAARQP